MANKALRKPTMQRDVMAKTSQKWLYVAPAVRSCHTWRKALPPVALPGSNRLGMSCSEGQSTASHLCREGRFCTRRGELAFAGALSIILAMQGLRVGSGSRLRASRQMGLSPSRVPKPGNP